MEVKQVSAFRKETIMLCWECDKYWVFLNMREFWFASNQLIECKYFLLKYQLSQQGFKGVWTMVYDFNISK